MCEETDPRITAILTLYKTKGNSNYYGEKVSKTDHMLQAAISAKRNGEPDRVVLACLLHDIGHFLAADDMCGLGVCDHGRIGAEYLRGLGMCSDVCALIEHHAEAKRYLVSTRSGYFSQLSAASKQTLVHQGGTMCKEERDRFECLPCFKGVLAVRRHDDIGKEVGAASVGVNHFIPLMKRHLGPQRSSPG